MSFPGKLALEFAAIVEARQQSKAKGVARAIDQKLRVTMMLVGAVTLKDLAAAFRRANLATSFEVDRAYRWMEGRARPRELRLYEDWAIAVDLTRRREPGLPIARLTTSSRSFVLATISTATRCSGENRDVALRRA